MMSVGVWGRLADSLCHIRLVCWFWVHFCFTTLVSMMYDRHDNVWSGARLCIARRSLHVLSSSYIS